MKLTHRILRRLFPGFYRAAVAQGDGGLVWFPVNPHLLPSDELEWVLVVVTEMIPSEQSPLKDVVLVTHVRRAKPRTVRNSLRDVANSPLDGPVYHAWAVMPAVPTDIKEMANGKQS